jgi:hypothetical protein
MCCLNINYVHEEQFLKEFVKDKLDITNSIIRIITYIGMEKIGHGLGDDNLH